MYLLTNIKKKKIKEKKQLFIGLEVHKLKWSVCIRTVEFEHRTFQQKADPVVLHQYIQKHFPAYPVRIAYEAGCFGFWISRELEVLGYCYLVFNAADIPGSDKFIVQSVCIVKFVCFA